MMEGPSQTAIEVPALQYLRQALGKQIVRHGAIFAVAEALSKAVPFLLIPVITRYLTTSDYGRVATFAALVNIAAVFVGLNAHGAVNVNFFQLPRAKMADYVASILGLLLLSAAGVGLVVFVFGHWLSQQIDLQLTWIYLAIVVALGQSITLLNLVLWQAEQRPTAYGVYQFAQSAVVMLLSILLVVSYGMGWVGQLSANLLGAVVFGMMSLAFLSVRGYISLHLDGDHIRDALAFGVPLIPHALSGWCLTGIDRFFLTALVGVSATGQYAAGYQFGLIVGIVAASFNRAWMPYLFKRLTAIDEAGKLRLVKLSYAYFAGILVFSLGLALSAPCVLRYFLGPGFQEARQYVFWIAMAFAFDGMYYMVVNQIFFMKKTRWLAAITLFTGVQHVLLSYFLIRHFGTLGAAYAMTLSFGTTFVLVWILSARVYPLPWNPWKWK